jgi:hypothetical protein
MANRIVLAIAPRRLDLRPGCLARDLLIEQCDAFRGRVEETPNFSCCAALYVASFGISVSQWRVLSFRLTITRTTCYRIRRSERHLADRVVE